MAPIEEGTCLPNHLSNVLRVLPWRNKTDEEPEMQTSIAKHFTRYSETRLIKYRSIVIHVQRQSAAHKNPNFGNPDSVIGGNGPDRPSRRRNNVLIPMETPWTGRYPRIHQISVRSERSGGFSKFISPSGTFNRSMSRVIESPGSVKIRLMRLQTNGLDWLQLFINQPKNSITSLRTVVVSSTWSIGFYR